MFVKRFVNGEIRLLPPKFNEESFQAHKAPPRKYSTNKDGPKSNQASIYQEQHCRKNFLDDGKVP